MARYRQAYSLYKRGDYWYYRTYDARGKRTSGKSTGKKQKNEAKKYCDKLYLTNSLYISSMRFYDYAAHFYDDDSPYVRDRVIPLSENTLKGYRERNRNQIIPYFKDFKIGDIKYNHLKQFRANLIEHYSASLVTAVMSCLKHIFDSAYRDGIIATNPYTYLEHLNTPNTERDAFTIDEVKYIYEKIPDEFKKQILLMALTGMRISESIGVVREDVIQGDTFKYIHLTHQKSNKKYVPLKNKNNRDIPIIPEIIDLIGFWDMRLSAFYREYNYIKKDLKEADERRLSFHSLRHFFITNAKSSGINDLKVEVIAGHTLKGITKVYTNFKVDDLAEILEWQREVYKKITLRIDNPESYTTS